MRDPRGRSCWQGVALRRRAAAIVLAASVVITPGARAVDECSPDTPPNAAFQINGCTGVQCTFTSLSTDSGNGWLVAQEWDFGDGAVLLGFNPTATHPFPGDGVYYVTLSVTDNEGAVATAMQPVVVGTGGLLTLATDDEVAADRAVATRITSAELLANDAPGVQFLQIEEPPTHGSLQPATGGFTYQSYSTFVGEDSFRYSVMDALQHVGEATVRVIVTRPPPVANPDTLLTNINVPVPFTVEALLANDSAGAVFGGFQNQKHGTITFDKTLENGQAQYLFTPEFNWAGPASFEYLISWDGEPPYEIGLVYVTIKDRLPWAAFWPPTCVNRTCTFRQHATDDLGIVDYYWEWGDGTSQHDATGNDITHTYAQSGRFVVRLTVTDTAGQSSFLGENDIWSDREVLANTKPVAINDTATTERDIAVTIPVLANDIDADGNALSMANLTVNHTGALVQIVPLGAGWALKLTPPDGFVGTLTLTYQAVDPWGGVSNTATVTVTVTQWASVLDAIGEQYWCPYNNQVQILKSALLANDYDSDSDPLTIVNIDSTVLAGFLDCTTDPTRCTFRAGLNQAGSTFFRYTISDPAGHRDTATVKIYIGSTIGSPPTLQDDVITTMRNTPKTFTRQEVLVNDTDPDGDTLTLGLAGGARDFGSLACLPSTYVYQCTYTPNAGFVGTDRFIYTAGDIVNPAQQAAITMLVLPPTTPVFDAREDLKYTPKGQQLWIPYTSLTENDYDPERDPISVASIDTTGLAGTMTTCDSSGCLFKPAIGSTGVTKFKYTATDGRGSTETVTVKVRVGLTNTPPVANPDSFTTPKNTVLKFSIFDLLRNDKDVDNDPVKVNISTWLATKGTLNCGTPNYWCTYTPNANVTGSDTISYALVNTDYSNTSSLTITITP